jgi:HK97 family phage portal protein
MGIVESYKSWRESLRDSDHEGGSGIVSLNLKAIPTLPQHTGSSGWMDYRGGGYFDSKIDLSTELGDLRGSSLVMSAIQWVSRSLVDARLMVTKYGSDRKETEVENHPLSVLWNKPNPFYSSQTLLAGLALSWITASRAYFIKTKAVAGNTLWLWWEPHWTIRPRWDEGGKDFISYYEIYRNGRWIRIETDDVVTVMNGVDPETRLGLINPNTAMLREYWTDNQVARFTAQMFRKGLVPPVVVGLGNFNGDIQAFKADLIRKMSGDSAGEPMVTKGDVTVERLGIDYSKFGFKAIREIPEERFCATMGISAHSLMLGIARDASTYDNVKQYLAHDYANYIKPLHKLISQELNTQLLPDFGSVQNISVNWDYAQTLLMQPDKDAEWKRAGEAFKNRILDQSEAREAIGYKSDESHKGVYYPVQSSMLTVSPLVAAPKEEDELTDDDPLPDPTKAAKLPKLPAKQTDEAAEFWRKHPALDEVGKSLIDAVPFVNGKVS